MQCGQVFRIIGAQKEWAACWREEIKQKENKLVSTGLKLMKNVAPLNWTLSFFFLSVSRNNSASGLTSRMWIVDLIPTSEPQLSLLIFAPLQARWLYMEIKLSRKGLMEVHCDIQMKKTCWNLQSLFPMGPNGSLQKVQPQVVPLLLRWE